MESSQHKNFYAVLGVARDATDKDIKQRFRVLARERHPDRFQGEEKAEAEIDFQNITEAFNVLMDPVRRRQVDLYLARPKGAVEQSPSDVVRVYMNRGIRAYKEGNLIEAAGNFDRAAQTEPSNVQAWHHLALTCAREPRWQQKAQDAITRTLELETQSCALFEARRKDLCAERDDVTGQTVLQSGSEARRFRRVHPKSPPRALP